MNPYPIFRFDLNEEDSDLFLSECNPELIVLATDVDWHPIRGATNCEEGRTEEYVICRNGARFGKGRKLLIVSESTMGNTWPVSRPSAFQSTREGAICSIWAHSTSKLCRKSIRHDLFSVHTNSGYISVKDSPVERPCVLHRPPYSVKGVTYRKAQTEPIIWSAVRNLHEYICKCKRRLASAIPAEVFHSVGNQAWTVQLMPIPNINNLRRLPGP